MEKVFGFFSPPLRVIGSLEAYGHGPIDRKENGCSWEEMAQQLTREMFEENLSQLPY